MVQYNKEILTKKTSALLKLEQKYGKIFTHDYNSLKKYNDLSEHLFENINIKGGKSKSTKLTTYQRLGQIKLVSCICFGLCILNIFSNIIFIWKLNGVIYPILILIICINLYILGTEYLDKLSVILSAKKGTIMKRINNAINLFVYGIRALPGIIVDIPNIPTPTGEMQPFKGIRTGIQTLIINVDINVNKYEIEIDIPSMEFTFMNPIAAICCAWDGFKAMMQPILDVLITPFVNLCKKIFEPIKKAIDWAKTNIIDPIANVVMAIWEAIKKFFNSIIDIFMGIISNFTWIPGIGDEIDKIVKKHRYEKMLDAHKLAQIEAQKRKQEKGHVTDKAAADAKAVAADKAAADSAAAAEQIVQQQ